MGQKEKVFVANWKMYLTPYNAVSLTKLLCETLQFNALCGLSRIVVCPSFSALALIEPLIRLTPICLGAQDCSLYQQGAHTGEESVQTLKALGCSYCIVGHSERRYGIGEGDKAIAKKVVLLLSQQITPILCIGETSNEFRDKKTHARLNSQLRCIFSNMNQDIFSSQQSIFIAYEPVWAIGSGIIPENKYLSEIFRFLREFCNAYLSPVSFKFLYGGSVNSTSVVTLTDISLIDGFLVGSASLDSQEFKKIVYYNNS